MTNSRLRDRLREYTSRQCWRSALYAAVGIGALSIMMVCFALLWLPDALHRYDAVMCILTIGVWTVLSLLLFFYVKNRRTENAAACELDRNFQAYNRMETTYQLLGDDSAVAKVQEENTESFYSGLLPVGWFQLRKTLLLAVVLEFLAGAGLWKYAEHDYYRLLSVQEQKHKERIEKLAKKEKPKPKNEFAWLKLVAPEPELRKRPLDEFEWKGIGGSSNGFKELKLLVYKNGELSGAYDIAPQKKGKIKFDDLMALDEFDAVPFDLISYHLSGRAMVNGDEVEVLSLPQFIEVRPFREDIEKFMSGGNMPPNLFAAANILSTFLNLQVMLHKTTFSARIRRKIYPDKPLGVGFDDVIKEQRFLYTRLRTLLDKGAIEVSDGAMFELKSLPAESVSCLEKAACCMENALSDLDSIVKK